MHLSTSQRKTNCIDGRPGFRSRLWNRPYSHSTSPVCPNCLKSCSSFKSLVFLLESPSGTIGSLISCWCSRSSPGSSCRSPSPLSFRLSNSRSPRWIGCIHRDCSSSPRHFKCPRTSEQLLVRTSTHTWNPSIAQICQGRGLCSSVHSRSSCSAKIEKPLWILLSNWFSQTNAKS